MKENGIAKKYDYLWKPFVILSMLTLLFSLNQLLDHSVVAQISPASSSSTSCPPVINGSSGSLTGLDILNLSLQADDCDGNTTTAQVRLFDARSVEVAKTVVTLNPLPPQGRFTVTLTLTGVSNFLGTCTAEVVLIDSANNVSAPTLINYRSCMLPIIGQFSADPLNGDKVRASIRGGDPDLNTNQLIFEIRNSSGSILRGPTTLDSSTVTLGRGDFTAILDIEGISLLSNPGIVKVQLKDRNGNLSNAVEDGFTAIKGNPDLTITSFNLDNSNVNAGAVVNVDIMIGNVGDAPAAGTNGEIRLSTDQVINSSDPLLDSFSIAALNPGQAAQGSRMVTIPASTKAGSYFLGIISDSGNAITDSNRTNNATSRPINIQNSADIVAPTIMVLTPKAGDAVLPGSTLKITYNSSDNTGVVSHNIDLSIDGGTSFNSLTQNLAGNIKEFNFVVPSDFSPATAQAVVRVIAKDAAGNTGIGLSAPFSIGDTIKPTIQLSAPVGGETIDAGSAFRISFAAMDNDMVTNIVASYSTDGGQTFPNLIGSVPAGISEIVWNVPDTLQTTLGRVQVVARDRSGNIANALSGVFTVQQKPSTVPSLVVSVSFDPPPPGIVAPPQNVRIDVDQIRKDATIASFAVAPKHLAQLLQHYDIGVSAAAAGPELLGFNIYRVPEPPEGQPLPSAADIVKPMNLVGAISVDSNSFIDQVTSNKSDTTNFVYSITSFFGNGQMSNGSQPMGTDLPVIKNPTFTKGTIFLDAAGSFIKSGALLTINDNDSYRLQFDDSGTLFTVPKRTPSMGSGIFLKKLVKKGSTVKLTVKNPDGKASVGMTFTRK